MKKLLFTAYFIVYMLSFDHFAFAQGYGVPAGMTLTCQFTNGPRAGQTQSFAGVPGVSPIPVGSPCTDGAGSYGTGVAAAGGMPPGVAAGTATGMPAGMTLSCQFTSGPRAGQTQSFAGVPGVNPIPVGSPCTDGIGSNGTGVAAAGGMPPGGTAGTVGGIPAGMTLTCRFTSGPRTGQTQSYAGVAGVNPIPIGSPCTDGAGSNGVGM